jgi:hypothetical protein
MQEIEYRTIDKAEWGPGPWQDEPDKAQWQDEETGLPCMILRNHSGALCGYVGVDSTHPWFGKGYSDEVEIPEGAMEREVESHRMPVIPMMVHAFKDDRENGKAAIDIVLDAHGGITFADACQKSDDPSKGICHLPEPGEPDNVWWFGFDCSHCDDLSPAYMTRQSGLRWYGEYRDINYVKAEIRGLAQQLASAQ